MRGQTDPRKQQAALKRFEEAQRRGAKDDVALHMRELDAYEEGRLAHEELAETCDRLLRAIGGPSIATSRQQYEAAVEAERARYRARAERLERDTERAAAALLTGMALYVVLAAASSEAATPADRQRAQQQIREQNNISRSGCQLQGRHYIEPFDDSRAIGWCAL